jgi:hypothetical protein
MSARAARRTVGERRRVCDAPVLFRSSLRVSLCHPVTLTSCPTVPFVVNLVFSGKTVLLLLFTPLNFMPSWRHRDDTTNCH